MSSSSSPTPPSSPKGGKAAKEAESESRRGGGGGGGGYTMASVSPPLDDPVVAALSKFLEVPRSHIALGVASNLAREDGEWRHLVLHRKLPQHGWTDLQIQRVLLALSSLDTSGKPRQWCGVGEREGRCYSSLVRSRHFGFAHGIGRSGDLQEPQPKAAGSTVLNKLATCLALDAVRRGSGLDAAAAARHGILLPMCTGMSTSLVLQSLPRHKDRNVVIWSRIDQKSCYKAIETAGYVCAVLPTRRVGDQVRTDLDALGGLLELHGGRVAAVLTTTSCFAPRAADAVDRVARLCRQHEVAHVVNHAYGLQCPAANKLLNRACAVGRVDAVVASTDKNFMVPVGTRIVL
jgi:O-phospho-L-seryl-tRNASec:L-selenocysteinyl-tRNA synthase